MVLVIAHRGASAAYPENTVEAFVGARDMGADWVELDVRLTLCGTPVVHHDADLAGGRFLSELEAAELPASIPTLVDAIEAIGPMGMNIEIKSDPREAGYDPEHRLVDAVVPIAQHLLGPERCLISSFDISAINRSRELDPTFPTGFLTADPVGVEVSAGRALAHGHGAINPGDALVSARWVAHAKNAGLNIYTWTIDDPARIAEVAAMGVDGIITNCPDVALQAIS